jgi:ketosteroid isomerase-like protein
MASRNVEIVRRMYAAFARGDAATALELFDPDVDVDATLRPDGARGRGREALATIIGGWIASFDDWREEVEEMRDLGDRVYVVATQRGRGKATGIEVEARYGVAYELVDGRIVSMRFDPEPPDAPPRD